MKQQFAALAVVLALTGCAGGREGAAIDARAREYLAAAAAGDADRIRAVSAGMQPVTLAAAIRARRPGLLQSPENAVREALEIRADTALVEFQTGPDWRTVGMRMERRAGEWKIIRVQVRHL